MSLPSSDWSTPTPTTSLANAECKRRGWLRVLLKVCVAVMVVLAFLMVLGGWYFLIAPSMQLSLIVFGSVAVVVLTLLVLFLRSRQNIAGKTVAICVLALGVLLVGGFYLVKGPTIAPPHTTPASQNSLIYDDTGRVIGQLPGAQNRVVVPASKIALVMKHAIVVREDRNFYHEPGISIKGIGRAVVTDLTHGDGLQGGSTLEQQYIKNTYFADIASNRSLTSSVSLSRKLKEIQLARALDQQYSKDDILALYLNTVYFGRGAYGVETAAQTYFGSHVHASNLSVVQAATLASLVKSPSYFGDTSSPTTPANTADLTQCDPKTVPDNIELWCRRANTLRLLTENPSRTNPWLSPNQLDTLRRQPLGLAPIKTATAADPCVSYVVAKARTYLTNWAEAAYGPSTGDAVISQGGLKLHLTVDYRQLCAMRSTILASSQPGGPLTGALTLDPATGAVKAWYGGPGPSHNQYDYAIDSHLEVGSSIKPFVLARAVMDGVSTNSVLPAPAFASVTPDNTCDPTYQPGDTKIYNGDRVAHGQTGLPAGLPRNSLTLKTALSQSSNPVHVELLCAVGGHGNDSTGPQRVVDLMNQMGINTEHSGNPAYSAAIPSAGKAILGAYPSMAIGSSTGLSPLEMASGYGTFANNGSHLQAYFVQQIVGAGGNVLYNHATDPATPHPVQVLTAAQAAAVTNAMRGVIKYGTGELADLGARPTVGKTGTSDSNYNAWFVGYTPVDPARPGTATRPGALVTAVAMFNDPQKSLDFHGGDRPAKVYAKIMSQALAAAPIVPLPPDPSIGTVDTLDDQGNLVPLDSVLPKPAPTPTQATSRPAPTPPAPTPTPSPTVTTTLTLSPTTGTTSSTPVVVITIGGSPSKSKPNG